ncbi:NAD-dependent epimerase/dehydratase family protein [Legionella longbeachae]|uniref:Protein capI n=1 Tax=Legionella longbeachae serogroup 1 (strain NSW150) TaxID=661367 RepID=D3HME6_LEGLN|nr:NAD-dependent epimerase/dehydratase family protein [Legionella longbeachae]VEE04056.1 protein capI [Legionella oakridgensis]HBD7396915.1 NAD-dependent epimerase/dehydratase family protein [Legionella pneumophila]ARB93095.1 capsular biosynthesis protein CpsI [Legionella longbeachae]ARM33844.1 NAD-dependent epimerase/dehydratase family protein [Legionella longbeachae]EEZ96979.1 NAD-dependent epimerase/dehydratase family protein [Legionella longbeachae D-4968]
MRILITGCAGFIGMHTALRFLERKEEVIGVDSLNNYYDVRLKKARLAQLTSSPNFKFYPFDIGHCQSVHNLFVDEKPSLVVHLAAQVGVRYSLINPQAYIDSNIQGFMNILEACRHHSIEHLVYASSSSVYGNNILIPFDESYDTCHPVSLYAATKKSNELMAHVYSHLYQLPTTGLRFFTVYGPWGRPDMAFFKFTQAMVTGKPIDIYNNGEMIRDFTYIDDIVEGIVRIVDKSSATANDDNLTKNSSADADIPYRVFNIGNNHPIDLITYIQAIEHALGIKALKNYLPMQPGDVLATAANIEALEEWISFKPSTPISLGVQHFVDWYREYYMKIMQ